MSAWGMGAGSAQAARLRELNIELSETKSLLESTQKQLEAHRIRDLLANVRLNQYGPMFVKMFDEDSEYKVELTSNLNISVTSTDRYDIVVENNLLDPCMRFKATKPIEGVGLSFPATLLIDLSYGMGSVGQDRDIQEYEFECIEEWFIHVLTGTPVDRYRNKRRSDEAKELLSFDLKREVDHGEYGG